LNLHHYECMSLDKYNVSFFITTLSEPLELYISIDKLLSGEAI